MIKINHIIFILVLSILLSCSTDFEITSEWSEEIAVFGLLNQKDPVHYLRIHRVYLNKENSALLYAQNPDSIYYGDELLVEVIELKPGGQTFTLERVDGDTLNPPIKKAEGLFSNSPNILYRLKAPLTDAHEYFLRIKNTKSGKEVTSQTALVKDFKITLPIPNGPVVNFVSSNGQTLRWENAENGGIYDVYAYLHYKVALSNDPLKFVREDSALLSFVRNNSYSTINIDFKVTKESFYTTINNAFDYSEDTIYHVGDMAFYFYVGSETFKQYIDFNRAQTGITANQITDGFTNIEGGHGLFASRYQKRVFPVVVSRHSVDSLACSPLAPNINWASHISSTNYPNCD